VAAVTIGDEDAAFPFSVLAEERVVHYTVGDQDLVVFFKPEPVPHWMACSSATPMR